MKFIISIFAIIILSSCSQNESENGVNKPAIPKSEQNNPNSFSSKDTTVQFLWREMVCETSLNDSVSSLFINYEYINLMSDPEKAALGYVATFVGNDCWWNGDADENRSNLDCRIITALDLGYQCSDRHLDFLRHWFRNDAEVLSELQKSNCPTTPNTSTIQDTFDDIELTVKGDSIIIHYNVRAVNLREQESWKWTETDYFKINKDYIKLIAKKKTKIKHESWEW